MTWFDCSKARLAHARRVGPGPAPTGSKGPSVLVSERPAAHRENGFRVVARALGDYRGAARGQTLHGGVPALLT